MWADFSIKSILGGILDPFTKPVTRKLSCKLPRVKEQFQEILEKEYTRHNLQQRIEDHVEKSTTEYKRTGKITNAMKEEYNQLHKLSENTIKHANRKCKKAHTGKVPFSPTTKKVQDAVAIWKEILKYKQQRKKNLKLII